MNHCIRNRILQPHRDHPDSPTLSGFVITPPLANTSKYRHYVFSEKCVYGMPAHLFRVVRTADMKNTKILRLEKPLEFGDNIFFTMNPDIREVHDYELGMQVHETDCKDGINLVRTIAVLPPRNMGNFCWTELFGNIELTDDQCERLHREAKHDVPIYAWISVDIEIYRNRNVDVELKTAFYEFIEVAVDDRKTAWDTDWNVNNANKPTIYYTWSTDEEEAATYNQITEKKEDEIFGVQLNLEGYLIDERELFCPKLKDHCVQIGLWSKSNAKAENNFDLQGSKFRFDAFFSDVLQIYIAYYYEDITEYEYWSEDDENEISGKECNIVLEDYGTKLIQIEIYPSDNFGQLYNTQNFGLILDHNRVLGPLPVLFAELEQEWLWVNVVDTGPGKKLSRFTIAELERQPEETIELIMEAKRLAMERENDDDDKHDIYGDGFVIDAKCTFFSPKYANQLIVIQRKDWPEFLVGHWMEFQARYQPDSNTYEIIGGRRAERAPVPHSKITEMVAGKKVIKHLFKIEAEIINNPNNDPSKIFFSGLLYNAHFGGLIYDPDGKFVKMKRLKKYRLIVECQPSGSTPFTLVRMSNADERMDSQRNGTANGVEEEEIPEVGLELEDQIDVNEEEDGPIMQVDFLSESAVRVRQMRARDRRRQRDKNEKLFLEQCRQLELEEVHEDGEENVEPATSASAAAV